MGPSAAQEAALDRKLRMKIPFQAQRARPVEERLQDFDETYVSLTAEEAIRAAERCIHCPEPAACQEACPVHNDIPAAMWLIEKGSFLDAAQVYRRTSSLPEICGRVCPHESLCQSACVRSKREEPVLTGALEAFVTDYERANGGVSIPIGPATGKRIAIVGAGPAVRYG